jgi:hypothetical protein
MLERNVTFLVTGGSFGKMDSMGISSAEWMSVDGIHDDLSRLLEWPQQFEFERSGFLISFVQPLFIFS